MAALQPEVERWTLHLRVDAVFAQWRLYHDLYGYKHAPPWRLPIRIRRSEVAIR